MLALLAWSCKVRKGIDESTAVSWLGTKYRCIMGGFAFPISFSFILLLKLLTVGLMQRLLCVLKSQMPLCGNAVGPVAELVAFLVLLLLSLLIPYPFPKLSLCCVWADRVQPDDLLLLVLPTHFFRQSISLNLEFTLWLDWLAHEPPGSSFLCPCQCWGHRSPLPLPAFYVNARIQTQGIICVQQALYPWSHFPAPTRNGLSNYIVFVLGDCINEFSKGTGLLQ